MTPPDHVPETIPATSRTHLGWVGHTLVLIGWIALIISNGRVREFAGVGAAPLSNADSLFRRLAEDTPVFAAFCLAAWLCSRASASQWRLRWRGGFAPIWRGLLYSVGIRLALLVPVVILVVALAFFHQLTPANTALLRPKVENAVSTRALAQDPIFFWAGIPLLSLFAGLREEIWRGGMLAGLAGIFPRLFGSRYGQWLAILPTSVLFGLAHLYMGWTAVVAAGLLGIALGAICVWHNSIWDAVIAHGLFDATSFVAIAYTAHHYPQTFGG